MSSTWNDAVELRPRQGNAGFDRSLSYLSKRVRALRARRGMTRKELSRRSDISERYLAQLESAGANPSLALLMRVASALSVDVHELLPYAKGSSQSSAPLRKVLGELTPEEQTAAYQLLVRHFSRH